MADIRYNSLSGIRFIALCMIIVCHITQYYNLEICQWFNVGVQIFLCISGFLFSHKEIGNIPRFLIKDLKKSLSHITLSLSYMVFYISSLRESYFHLIDFWGESFSKRDSLVQGICGLWQLS